ncbi:hypothetical protein SAMN03159341_103179 [Paenibacillus sp. 1_12]|uniref:hypothetical protein n=1 Tax=Paenibacillus sp. 1_12 TaxID=1566278 RepID=UPI0008E08D36|nr:hypothetical protein [Paenibacillus sp. 1_12]SFL09452.1 hypothetical protein SAMN03159341_103179 [Paenibacillus sp. 1_12]
MSRLKLFTVFVVAGYLIGLLATLFVPVYVAFLLPAGLSFLALIFFKPKHPMQGAKPFAEPIAPSQASTPLPSSPQDSLTKDPIWGPVLEYIGVLEDMMISEGQKDNLDNEIVEKTLSLLTRLQRVIPQLQELNDGNINHNIHRLVFKDLNGAVNPFLKLSGEAKRQNRRLLLSGLKDINSKISFYVESIEHRDLIDLQTKIDLIHERYNVQN